MAFGAPDYHVARTPNCTIRPSSSVETGARLGPLVITPALFTTAFVLIVVMFGWFSTLFASAKNCGCKRSHK